MLTLARRVLTVLLANQFAPIAPQVTFACNELLFLLSALVATTRQPLLLNAVCVPRVTTVLKAQPSRFGAMQAPMQNPSKLLVRRVRLAITVNKVLQCLRHVRLEATRQRANSNVIHVQQATAALRVVQCPLNALGALTASRVSTTAEFVTRGTIAWPGLEVSRPVLLGPTVWFSNLCVGPVQLATSVQRQQRYHRSVKAEPTQAAGKVFARSARKVITVRRGLRSPPFAKAVSIASRDQVCALRVIQDITAQSGPQRSWDA